MTDAARFPKKAPDTFNYPLTSTNSGQSGSEGLSPPIKSRDITEGGASSTLRHLGQINVPVSNKKYFRFHTN